VARAALTCARSAHGWSCTSFMYKSFESFKSKTLLPRKSFVASNNSSMTSMYSFVHSVLVSLLYLFSANDESEKIKQRLPISASSSPSVRIQLGQIKTSLFSKFFWTASWIFPKRFKILVEKPSDKLVSPFVMKNSPMLLRFREISTACDPLQMLKLTQFSLTTKASFKLSRRLPSSSKSTADLACLILSFFPFKAARIAAICSCSVPT